MVRPNLDVELTSRQWGAWEALSDPGVREVLYGGAKGGGKSHLLCVWAYMRAYQIACDHDLRRSKNPPHVGWMGRKLANTFTATTLATWRRVIPEGCYELRGGTERDPTHILIDGRVAIDYGGLDRQEVVQKFNSAEYAFLAIDQAEEVTKDDIAALRASLRMTLGGKSLGYKTLFTANPRQCWLKDEFVVVRSDGRRFIQALPSDNPYLPAGYLDTLESAFKHRPELLDAYRKMIETF